MLIVRDGAASRRANEAHRFQKQGHDEAEKKAASVGAVGDPSYASGVERRVGPDDLRNEPEENSSGGANVKHTYEDEPEKDLDAVGWEHDKVRA